MAKSNSTSLKQFKTPHKLNTTPSWKDLCQYVTPRFAPNWKVIGGLLGLSNAALKIIELNNHYQTVACCNAMFNKWLQHDPNAVWKHLFDVIESPAVCSDQAVDEATVDVLKWLLALSLAVAVFCLLNQLIQCLQAQHHQAKHVQQPKVVMKRIVLMSAPQMMTVNMIGYVVVMDVEDTLVLTLLKCVDQNVFCDWPVCEGGAQPVTSPFSCCPYCPTTACPVEGQVRVECASACNTCAKVNTPVICLKVYFVSSCQCPSGTVIDEQTDTCVPSPDCPSTGCPVKSQVRVDCASSCVVMCANLNSLQYCPKSCRLNGSECPQGSVINEKINICVWPADCNSTTVCFCTGQTCPTVQSTNEENCVDECSSDDDCQYDRICCSNGCGGHTCSNSVEMCQLIQCDWPVYEDGAEPITIPFICCPYCPTTGGVTDDNGGTGVIAITSLMAVTMCGLLTIFF